MTIRWDLPVETTETPPRPVRVLCTDNEVSGYPIVALVGRQPIMFTKDGTEWLDDAAGITLRNVAPKPVQYEAWVNLYSCGLIGSLYANSKDADAAAANPNRVECRRIVWHSDGSPVDDSLMLANRVLTARAEALQAEVRRVRKAYTEDMEKYQPVVDAAVAWVAKNSVMRDPYDADLFAKVRAFLGQQAAEPVKEAMWDMGKQTREAVADSMAQPRPDAFLAEPVKNCTTCRWPWRGAVACRLSGCRGSLDAFCGWEAKRHD